MIPAKSVVPATRSAAHTLIWRNVPSTAAFGNSKRDIFTANAIIDSWIYASKIRHRQVDPKSLEMFLHYAKLMVLIDKNIDVKGFRAVKDVLRDPDVRQIRKDYFAVAKKFDDKRQQKLKMMFSESTKRMIGALKKREPGLKGFDDTMAFRQKTSGEMGRAIAAIMNTAHNIPAEKAEKIERAFENVSMAGQVYDDLQDLSQDRNEHVKENIIYQILRKNPEELAKVGDSLKISPKIGFRRLKRLAPNTAQEAADLQKKYLDNIGPEKEFSHLRGFAGLIELR